MSTFGEMMRRARRDALEGDWAPPPGEHEAVVIEGDAFESKAGDPYAKTTLALRAPGDDDDGRTWDHLMGFRTPQQAQMSAGQLSLYGIGDEALDNLDDIGDLARHMAELAGAVVHVSCKSRNPDNLDDGVWTNITGARGHGSDVPADTVGLGDPVGAQVYAEQQAELGDGGDPPPRRHDAADGSDYPF